MANVTYSFDFKTYHVHKVLAQESLKDIVSKGIKKAKLRQSAHTRGGKNTMLVMNDSQEQQLHAYIGTKKVFGDGILVPVYGYIVVGYSEGKGTVYTGGSIEVNIAKEKSSGNQPPTFMLTHCGALSDDATFVGTTKYQKWEETWGKNTLNV